jgi:hypothetical protein
MEERLLLHSPAVRRRIGAISLSFESPVSGTRRYHMTTIMLHQCHTMKPSRRAIRAHGVFRLLHREGVVD